jgi:hypothetical protein
MCREGSPARSERSEIVEGKWLAALDDFRNWLALGLQPAKAHENRPLGQNGDGGSGEIESSQWSRRGRATV